MVDLCRLDPRLRINGSVHPLAYLARTARANLVTMVPVTGLQRDTAYETALKEAVAEDKNVDRLTQEVAKLRAALIAANEEERGEKLMLKLGPLMTQNGLFRFTAQELTGLDSFFNEDYDEAERVFNLLQNDPAAPAGARQRAAAWQGLLHSVRGVKKGPAPGEITSVTPVIEPADGTDPRDAPAVTIEKK